MMRWLSAVAVVAAIVGYVVWQRPEPPVVPPPPPKEVVFQYADGSKMWSSLDGSFRAPPLAARVFRELDQASVSYDSLRVTGGVVRTTIDAKAQTVAAAVIGRLLAPERRLGAAVVAVEPASGAVRVYVPGPNYEADRADGMVATPSPALVEPFALAGVPSLVPAHASPLTVSAAYATVAAGGIQREPYFVSDVKGADGSLLYKAVDDGKPVLDQDVAERITAGLKDKVGCSGAACVLGAHPWLAGYTPELSFAVFLLPDRPGQVGVATDDPDLPRVIWQEFLASMAG